MLALVNQNLSWHCHASGIPLPSVKWQRRDGEFIKWLIHFYEHFFLIKGTKIN